MENILPIFISLIGAGVSIAIARQTVLDMIHGTSDFDDLIAG